MAGRASEDGGGKRFQKRASERTLFIKFKKGLLMTSFTKTTHHGRIWGELRRLPIKLSIYKHLLVYYHRLLV